MTDDAKRDLCDCGSGRPADDCCSARLRRVRASITEQDELREAFTEKHGHTRRPLGVEFGGKVTVAIGGSIYQQTRPGPYNFVNLLHDTALELFGDDRLAVEERKEPHLRHPALQWMHAFLDRHSVAPDLQDGYGAAWIRFGYDLFSVRDNAELQVELRKKLLDPRKFQAGRYELKVAALFSAAGFDLHFENEQDKSRKHPEFFGVDRLAGGRIAVEVKSRHWKGVLGFAEGTEFSDMARLGIKRLVRDAYDKRPGVPFYIFVDMNLPPADTKRLEQWWDELDSAVNGLAENGQVDPSIANAIFFSNDPSHYVGAGALRDEPDVLWMHPIEAANPLYPNPTGDMVLRILRAHSQRVTPPARFYECR